VKILIIDDESLDLFIARKLLALEFEVEGFTALSEILSWAKTNTFDVVLIDYYLGPGLFAHHVLKELLALHGPPFRAFVLSNHVDETQTRELKEAGFADIIYKPLTLEKFKDYLQGVH
jgi:DNA-binding NarL/FixJ family response regulator